MSDKDQPTPPQPPPTIPEDAQARWRQFAVEQFMILPLTKGMVDDLLLSIRQSIISTSHLSAAFQNFSNGKQEEAQVAFNDHLVTLDESWKRVNRLATEIMYAAQPVPDENND